MAVGWTGERSFIHELQIAAGEQLERGEVGVDQRVDERADCRDLRLIKS